MPNKCMYFWKDKNGQTKQSEGIELDVYEQAELCKQNLQRVREQLGQENTSVRELPEVD